MAPFLRGFLVCGLLIASIGACQLVARKVYGIKNPKVEDRTSLTRKAAHFGLDTSNIVALKSRYFLGEYGGNSVPDAAIFDDKGNYVEYRAADTSCNAGLFDFIPALDPSASYNKTGKTTLAQEWEKFADMNGGPLAPWKQDGTDFYVLIYWVVWEGRLNEDHVAVWEQLAKENHRARIRVVKVNLDFQQHWPEEERHRILEAVRKR